MTTTKLIEVVRFYNHYMDEVRNAIADEVPTDPSNYSHLMWMCDRIEFDFVPAGEIDKAMRWLGFIQGCLLCKGDFTLSQLRDHSRSSG